MNPFEAIAQRIDPHAALLRAEPLTGGISAQVTKLEIERPDGKIEHLVVRQHGARDLAANPHIAADEYRLLSALHSVDLPVPTPYFFDESGDILTSPYIVVEFIDGSTDFAPAAPLDAVRQLAQTLAHIHRFDTGMIDLAFLRHQTDEYIEKLNNRPPLMDDSLSEGRIRAVLEAVGKPPQQNPSVLLHGDYWTGNTIWQNGNLIGVIDWEDACMGDPLADLCHAKLEILWSHGMDAMMGFTEQYLTVNPIDMTSAPYWELYAALSPAGRLHTWGIAPEIEARMREQHRWYVDRAIAAISTTI